jgi:hypothetical protein
MTNPVADPTAANKAVRQAHKATYLTRASLDVKIEKLDGRLTLALRLF